MGMEVYRWAGLVLRLGVFRGRWALGLLVRAVHAVRHIVADASSVGDFMLYMVAVKMLVAEPTFSLILRRIEEPAPF